MEFCGGKGSNPLLFFFFLLSVLSVFAFFFRFFFPPFLFFSFCSFFFWVSFSSRQRRLRGAGSGKGRRAATGDRHGRGSCQWRAAWASTERRKSGRMGGRGGDEEKLKSLFSLKEWPPSCADDRGQRGSRGCVENVGNSGACYLMMVQGARFVEMAERLGQRWASLAYFRIRGLAVGGRRKRGTAVGGLLLWFLGSFFRLDLVFSLSSQWIPRLPRFSFPLSRKRGAAITAWTAVRDTAGGASARGASVEFVRGEE